MADIGPPGLGSTPPDRILVVNAGSSSLKLRVVGVGDIELAAADLPALGGSDTASPQDADLAALADRVASFGPVDAVGHRVVHGGTTFTGPALLGPATLAGIRDLASLAPLHQLRALAAIDAVSRILPEVPAVACFDTSFHTTIPEAATTYALPAAWRHRWGLRRFGFHGLSHAYASRYVAELQGRDSDPEFRMITCHLGAGASLTAVRGGLSNATTMGFTPLEGMVMATRSGDVDPGLVVWLAVHGGLSMAEISDGLEHRSGLAGLAGDPDMRAALDREGRGDADAALALAVYVHRLRGGIASMAAALGGLDTITFSGGVGERSAEIRARAAAGLGFLGIALDDTANRADASDAREISASDAVVRAWVIPAREEVEIARQVRQVIAGS